MSPDDGPDDTIGMVVVPFTGVSVSQEFSAVMQYSLSDLPTVMVNLSYRLSCIENYYGGDCSVFCEARDDDSGHYTCDAQGNIVCNDGYQGTDTNCITREFTQHTNLF